MKIKLDNIKKINENALIELEKGNFNEAQQLFRLNAKKNPCFISINNLGVYYVTEGMELNGGNVQNADKIGLRYLNKAMSYSESYLNFMAIGDVYIKLEQYDISENYFSKASKMCEKYSCYNNLAVALHMQGKYLKATEYFSKAFKLCDNSEDLTKIGYSYAFSLLRTDIKKGYSILKEIINSNIERDIHDEFKIAYLCNDFNLVESYISELFDKWSLSILDMAILFDSLFRIKKYDEASEYLNLQIECLEGYDYNYSRKEIMKLRKIYTDKVFREKVISEFKYIPLLIKECYYSFCPKHNLDVT